MFQIMKMGLLNVTRNKRRTIITISMITFGMLVIIFVSGFLESISKSLQESLILSETGDLQIMAKGYKRYKSSGSLDYTIQNVSKLIGELKREPQIASLTPRITVGGLLSNGNQSVYCWGTAIEPATVNEALPKLLTAKTGASRELRLDKSDGTVIGAGLAKKLGANPGSILTLVAYDKYGAMNAVDLIVTDMTQYTTDAENDGKIIMTEGNARKLLGLEDEATEICIKLHDRSQMEELKNSLNRKYGARYGIEFYTWPELMGSYAQIISMFQGVQFIILLIMVVVVLIAVINTILMSVFERTHEIGTLMAIGSSRGRIIKIFMAESFWLGLTGIIIGSISGIILSSLLAIKGIPFSAPGTTQTAYIKPMLNADLVLTPAMILLLVSILAGIYPSRYAAKLDPIEAIDRF